MKAKLADRLLNVALVLILAGAWIAGYIPMSGQGHNPEALDEVVAEYWVDVEKRDGYILYSTQNNVLITVVGDEVSEKDFPMPGERVALMFYHKSQAQMCQDSRCLDVDVVVKKNTFLRRKR